MPALHEKGDGLAAGVQGFFDHLGALRDKQPLLRVPPVSQLGFGQPGKGGQLWAGEVVKLYDLHPFCLLSVLVVLLPVVLQDLAGAAVNGVLVFHTTGAELYLILQTAIILVLLDLKAADLVFGYSGVGQSNALGLVRSDPRGDGAASRSTLLVFRRGRGGRTVRSPLRIAPVKASTRYSCSSRPGWLSSTS